MRARTARGSFLDPRTKILIWLLANVVVFTWAPAVFRIAVMLAYFGLFLLERKGKTLAGLLLVYLVIVAVQFWLLPLFLFWRLRCGSKRKSGRKRRKCFRFWKAAGKG